MELRPHFVLIGGFLGAGKTTAVARFARYLADEGLRAALITNDQGSELVDTATLRARGFETAEIPGGCFCCRFDALLGTSRGMCGGEHPEVFVAEAVGSCTDLAATVSYPMQRLHGSEFTVAPLSVLVDPARARALLDGGATRGFHDDVLYILEKQLEEADLIVVTKCDLLDPSARNAIHSGLAARFPRAEVYEVSARDGTGLGTWFRRILFGQQKPRSTIEVDYERYATGEAMLGWLNGTVDVGADSPFDPDALLLRVAAAVQQRLCGGGATIAHFKLTIQPAAGDGREIGSANLVRNDSSPETGIRLGREIAAGRVVVNLRAEGQPEALASAVTDAFLALGPAHGIKCGFGHLEFFRPGRPQPTHRDVHPASTFS